MLIFVLKLKNYVALVTVTLYIKLQVFHTNISQNEQFEFQKKDAKIIEFDRKVGVSNGGNFQISFCI